LPVSKKEQEQMRSQPLESKIRKQLKFKFEARTTSIDGSSKQTQRIANKDKQENKANQESWHTKGT